MRKRVITSFLTLGSITVVFFIDPAIKRKVEFENYAVKYEWRIFNNSYCNIRTAGHCFNNELNRKNAEMELCKTLLDNYNGQKEIEAKLKEYVYQNYRLDMTYSKLTKTRDVEIDSLIKYRDVIFGKIALK